MKSFLFSAFIQRGIFFRKFYLSRLPRKNILTGLRDCVRNFVVILLLSPRFKKFGKTRLRSKLLLTLLYDLSFRIQAASFFSQSLVQTTGLIFYLADFQLLNIEPYSPLKPTKVGFIFIRPYSLSRAEDYTAVNHLTQAVVRVGLKIRS